MTKTEPPILDIKNLAMHFGGIKAIDNVSFHINSNEIFALIGPNGAGKTTMFNCITGVYTPTCGSIFLYNKLSGSHYLNGHPPHTVNRMGIARTFQNIRLFNDMTVFENILIAAQSSYDHSLFGSIVHSKKSRDHHSQCVQISHELLKLVSLSGSTNEIASSLPYGDQRRLEIARALATEPRLLLLDEPAAGMNPQETIELVDLIKKIQEELKISIMLIEHDMHLVMTLSERICVVDYGQKIAEGSPKEIQNHPEVIRAYLGE